MRLSSRAYDFFGQEQRSKKGTDIRRVLENKPLDVRREEVEDILSKTEDITGFKPLFDEIKLSSRLPSGNVAAVTGAKRTRLTIDDTFYGFPEALQIMVIAHENIHAHDRKQMMQGALRKVYSVGDGTEIEFKEYMNSGGYEREAATHLLATKTLANNFFRKFRSGVDVRTFEEEFRSGGNNLDAIEEQGYGIATTLYPSDGMVIMGSGSGSSHWEGKPEPEQVEQREGYSLVKGGEKINDGQKLKYDIIEGSCCYQGGVF